MQRLLFYTLLILLLSGCSTPREAVQLQDTSGSNQSTKTDTLDSAEVRKARSLYIQGIKEFELENYEAALEDLSKARARLSDEAGVNYALADTYLKLDNLAKAAQYGKKATQLKPKNKWYHLKLYEIYRKAGRNQATIDELKRILKYHPEDVEILRRLAQTYNNYGDHLKAIRVYNKMLKYKGPDIRIHLKKFRNFRELGMRDSTLKELERIQSLDPDNILILHKLSEFYMKRGKPDEAKKILTDALNQNPRNPKSLIMMAETYMKEHKWDSAGTMLQNIVTDTLINPSGKMEIARFMYSRFKKNPNNSQLKQQTQQILSLLTEYEPELGKGHALAADFYLETSQNQKALQQLRKALKLNPHNTAIWRERIRLLYVQRKHERIIELAPKADQYAPQDPFITFFIGSSHLLNENHKQAIKWLSESTSLPAKKSFKSVVYGSLGDAYAAIDQWKQADQAYQQALKRDSTNHNAMNNYAYYLSKRDKRLEYAKQLALKALELLPGNSSYLDTAGWVFYKLGNYEKARKYIEQAAQSPNPGVTVLEHLGDVYQKLDKLEKAKKWWKKAYQKDPTKKHLKRKIEKNSTP